MTLSKEYPAEHSQGLSLAAAILGHKTLDLLGVDESSEVSELKQWRRGGAETFVTDFWYQSDTLPSTHLIAKACVKLCSGIKMAEWFERREVLRDNGVIFPKVYALNFDGATWVEEFIPYSFREAYGEAGTSDKKALEESYVDTALRIEGAGFTPLSLHDFRSRGNDVIMIDVGDDLGGRRDIVQCDLSARQRAAQSLNNAIKGHR